MSFSQAVSGLNAASSNLDVIGNNISNSATAGYKASSVAFADMFAGSKIGLGTRVAAVVQDFGDGTTNTTNRGLDVAISNAGFFRMTDSAGGVFYSRNGQFTLDENRNIVNMQGQNLTGYPAAGNPLTVQTGATPVALSVPTTAMPASATTKSALVANLNSTDSPPATTTFDPDDSTSFTAHTQMTVYDSLGNEHAVDLYFGKTSNNNWTAHAVDTTTGQAAGTFTMTFNSNGQLTSQATQTLSLSSLNGSAAQTFSFNLTGSQQQNVASNFGSPSQDGYKPGALTSYAINDDGTIVGTYANEKTQVLGQILMANFANVEGLKSVGDNLWAETASSGQALVGLAGTGNLGTLTSGALEASNVDLAKELTNMIVAQRNYQSNAQTIKTQDQLLNTMVNLR